LEYNMMLWFAGAAKVGEMDATLVAFANSRCIVFRALGSEAIRVNTMVTPELREAAIFKRASAKPPPYDEEPTNICAIDIGTAPLSGMDETRKFPPSSPTRPAVSVDANARVASAMDASCVEIFPFTLKWRVIFGDTPSFASA
jgi:hypothetical protein